jgi:cytochrome o ubiquinol oxidase operon protein cyoD
MMSDTAADPEKHMEKPEHGAQLLFIGLGLAALLTAASFAIVATDVIWPPGRTAALLVLAIAQMGYTSCFSCIFRLRRATSTISWPWPSDC